MTGIGTLFTVGVSMIIPLMLLVAAPIAAIWLAGKMCDCGRRTSNA